MRRKAKELQQARRDADRSGKKSPGFSGGFGSMSSSSNATIITDTLMEPEKPKASPVPARYYPRYIRILRCFDCYDECILCSMCKTYLLVYFLVGYAQ